MQYLKKLLKIDGDPNNSKVRTAYGKLSGYFGIICNIILFVGKLIAGMLSGSVSVTADAVNNLSDASSSVISLIGFKIGERPADEEHPYGHARYEYLSGLFVSVLILLIGAELFRGSFNKILHPSPVEFSPVIAVILIISIIVKLGMAMFNIKIGKLINSQALMATFADSRNDVISTTAVLAAAIISSKTSLELDGYVGVLVAIFILVSGFGLIKDTMNPLIGATPDDEMVKAIRDKILGYDGVIGTHDLMIHDYGPCNKFASVHVEMASERDVMESHEIIDDIERDFMKDFNMHLVVHYDPICTTNPELDTFRNWLLNNVRKIDGRLTVHDVRTVPGPNKTSVIFDCVVPQKFNMTDTEIKATLREMVSNTYPNYYCSITIDHSFVTVANEN